MGAFAAAEFDGGTVAWCSAGPVPGGSGDGGMVRRLFGDGELQRRHCRGPADVRRRCGREVEAGKFQLTRVRRQTAGGTQAEWASSGCGRGAAWRFCGTLPPRRRASMSPRRSPSARGEGCRRLTSHFLLLFSPRRPISPPRTNPAPSPPPFDFIETSASRIY